MNDQTITDASAALGRLAQFGRALADAEKVIAGLASAEQVGRELDAALAEKRAELEDLEGKIAVSRDAIVDAEGAATSKVETADRQAAEMLARAREDAQRIRMSAEQTLATAKAEAVQWAEQETEAKAEVEKAHADLAALQTRIADLTGKAAKIEAAKAEAAEALDS